MSDAYVLYSSSTSGAILVNGVVATSTAVPTIAGVYSFSGIPTGGLPAGVNLGDIVQLSGSTWTSLYTISASTCPATIIVGTTETTAVPYNLYQGVYVPAANSGAIYTNSIATSTLVTSTGSTATTAVTVFGIEAPFAGTWGICYTLANAQGASDVSQAGLFSLGSSAIPVANSAVGGTYVNGSSVTLISNGGSAETVASSVSSGMIWITTSTATNFAVGVWSAGNATSINNATYTGANSTLSIVGYPSSSVTGQVNVFSQVSLSASIPSLADSTTPVVFDQNIAGSIPYNIATGEWTLSSGITYRLTATIRQSGSAGMDFGWCDTSGSLLNAHLASGNSGGTYSEQVIDIIYTPSVTQNVYLAPIAGGPGGVYGAVGSGTSTAIVMQLGSSSATVLATMIGATVANPGLSGLVPAPQVNQIDYTLKGDGTWSGQERLPFKYLSLSSSATISAIDNYSAINIKATATGLAFTLPAPVITTSELKLVVANAGTTNSFTMNGNTVSVGSALEFVWNASLVTPAWQLVGSAASSAPLLLKAVVGTGGTVPTINGLYSFAGVPSGGLPSGVNIGDIVQLTGLIWSTLYSISTGVCPATVLVGTSESNGVSYVLSSGIYSQVAIEPSVEQVDTSGGAAIQVNPGVIRLIVNPPSLVSACTITLDASPNSITGKLDIIFGGTITANLPVITNLTISPSAGQTIFQSLTPVVAYSGDTLTYEYSPTNSQWNRLN